MRHVWLMVLWVGCSAGGPAGSGGGAGGSAGGGGGSDAGSDAGLADSGPMDAGQGDAGKTDAGGTDGGVSDGGLTGSRFWDGGACLVKTDCPCFSSDDCGPTFTCHSEDSSGAHVYCVPGARGDGGLNAPCTGEGDCASALCVDATSGQRCTTLCESAAQCGGSLPRCLSVGFGVDRSICAPP